jgi:polysaccharide pyruvyl transferase WcaK-like protein
VRITFFGHFGTPNSGNESTLLAILSNVRRLAPEAEFSCVCSNPEAVSMDYGIEAMPISSRSLEFRKNPLRNAIPALREEIGEYKRASKVLAEADALIVPGTGLITDAYGLASYGPYSVFKWTLMAKRHRCKVFFVSVGVGPINTRLGWRLVTKNLARATYRSYRDDSSLQYLADRGLPVAGDTVAPDLAFSIPKEVLPPSTRQARPRRVIGLGLMSAPGMYGVGHSVSETYSAYLDALVEFVDWALAHDYDLRLFLGDADTQVVDDFYALLKERVDGYDESRVVAQLSTTVQATLSELAASDVVVATRFHNVLLSLLLGKPVISLSFHDKCDSLMNAVGLSDYLHPIDTMDAERLINQFQELEAKAPDLEPGVSEKVEQYRRELDEQYRQILALVGSAGVPAPEPEPASPGAGAVAEELHESSTAR